MLGSIRRFFGGSTEPRSRDEQKRARHDRRKLQRAIARTDGSQTERGVSLLAGHPAADESAADAPHSSERVAFVNTGVSVEKAGSSSSGTQAGSDVDEVLSADTGAASQFTNGRHLDAGMDTLSNADSDTLSDKDHQDDEEDAADPYDDGVGTKTSPIEPGSQRASWCSRVTYWWANPMIKIGYRRQIRPSDLWKLPTEMQAQTYYGDVQRAWERKRVLYAGYTLEDEQRDLAIAAQPVSYRTAILNAIVNFFALVCNLFRCRTPMTGRYPFVRALFEAFQFRFYWFMVLHKVLYLILVFIKPVLLMEMLQFLVMTPPTDPWGLNMGMWYGYGLALLIAIAAMLQATVMHWYYWLGVRSALSVRGSCISMIYRKALDMNTATKRDFPAGQVVNLASVDADNIMNFCWASIHEIWASPLMIIICMAGLLMLLVGGNVCVCVCVSVCMCVCTYSGGQSLQHDRCYRAGAKHRIRHGRTEASWLGWYAQCVFCYSCIQPVL